MRTSEKGIEFIGSYEGFKANLYNCPAGHATIGFGRLVHYGGIDGRPSEAKYKDGISREIGLEMLKTDLLTAEAEVAALIKVVLSQEQFDALVSLDYNIGGSGLKRSTVREKINSGFKPENFKENWLAWNKGGGKVLPGLVKRRQAEFDLFTTGKYNLND